MTANNLTEQNLLTSLLQLNRFNYDISDTAMGKHLKKLFFT